MRFVMFTVVGEQGAAEWDAMPGEERRAFIELHDAWFREHREQIFGGEQLGLPAAARTIRRRRGQLSVTDGPFSETKELLGGFIVIEAPDLDAAVAIAASWPSLRTDGNTVEVRPTGSAS